jgi:XTP/dITP diphosphohydrolase
MGMHELSLVLATNNPHKVKEIRDILPESFNFLTLSEAGISSQLPETTGTIPGNALQKARTVWELTGLNCLADDSGLLVDALEGQPGVDSAHFAGLPPNPEANNAKLLNLMKGHENRKAAFVSVLALILYGEEMLFEGRINGTIAKRLRGNEGFGYDPLFIPDGFKLTFAQMKPQEKNLISHRARALEALQSYFDLKI